MTYSGNFFKYSGKNFVGTRKESKLHLFPILRKEKEKLISKLGKEKTELIFLPPKDAIYLTKDMIQRPYQAREYLAVTQSLHWRTTMEVLDPTAMTNAYGKTTGASRVWPAFGHHGGGREWITTRVNVSPVGNSARVLPNQSDFQTPGSLDDTFTLNSTAFRDLNLVYSEGVERIRLIIMKVYYRRLGKKIEYIERIRQELDLPEERKKEEPKNYSLAIKTAPESGIIMIYLIPSQRPKEYRFLPAAISCAFKLAADQKQLELKFWGYVWRDPEQYENSKKRYLSKAVIRMVRLKGILDLEASEDRIDALLEEMERKLLTIAESFDDQYEQEIELLSSNDFNKFFLR